MLRFSFFEKLTYPNRELLLKHAMEASMPKGMELFHQGDVCDNILFLTEGYVRVYRSHISGQEITLYFLEQFEQCNVNLNSAFTQTPAVGTAVTQSEIRGYMIPPNIVQEVYVNDPAYQQYIFELFAKRLETMALLVEDVRFENLDDRVIKWIKENGKNGILNITHEALANHLGSSREVISRLLKGMEKDGILTLKRGEITLNDNHTS
jgi:CRP/FNR family transcriptional regulator